MPALLKMQNMEGENMGCAALINEYAGGSVHSNDEMQSFDDKQN